MCFLGESPKTLLLSRAARRQNVFHALVAIDDQIRPALTRKKYVILKSTVLSRGGWVHDIKVKSSIFPT